MGIIGFGRIGQAEARIAKALGMNVLAYDLYPNDPGRAIVEYVTLDELYTRADVITLHCNLTPENTGMINKDGIAKMKDSVILINNARGQLIDKQDVADALNCGKMAVAGLDVVFNSLLIFPTRQLGAFTLPGADLGVTGAALGTALSETVVAIILCICLLRSPMLGLRKGERLRFVPVQLRRAVRLGAPVAIEQAVMSSAQVVTTRIIAPLGTVAIAANSFAVTAEALCYMPGYGVQSAAVTLIGQSVGAKRKDLVTRLGWVTVLLGMGVMLVASALMYALAPWIIGMLSPDRQVVLLGTQVLRIVVFSEPLFGASIVTAGVFQGAGSSLLSSVLNFVSMWGVRITLTLLLVPHWGLRGAWIAMCIELCFRGSLFLFFLWRKRWLPRELV